MLYTQAFITIKPNSILKWTPELFPKGKCAELMSCQVSCRENKFLVSVTKYALVNDVFQSHWQFSFPDEHRWWTCGMDEAKAMIWRPVTLGKRRVYGIHTHMDTYYWSTVDLQYYPCSLFIFYIVVCVCAS